MGASNSNTGKNIKYYQLKAKVDETNNPYFGLSEKVNDKWTITNRFDTMSGMLCSADIKEREYEGVKSKVFVLVIEDNDEKSQIEMTHNSLSHSIINSLSSNVNTLSTYTMQVYKKLDNGKWWGKVSFKIDGEKSNWKIDPATAPKKEPVMVNGAQFIQNGKPVFDDAKLKAFYEDLFRNEIMSKLPTQSGVKSAGTGQNTANSDAITDVTPIKDDSGLPF